MLNYNLRKTWPRGHIIKQLLTLISINIKTYRSNMYDIYLGCGLDKYHISWNDRSLYYIWCGFRKISLAKSVSWYTEYLMYFFHCEETRRLVSIFKKYWRYVSIFKYIDAMLLNLDPDIVRSGPRLHSTCSKTIF
jgi:hypothetical protein